MSPGGEHLRYFRGYTARLRLKRGAFAQRILGSRGLVEVQKGNLCQRTLGSRGLVGV